MKPSQAKKKSWEAVQDRLAGEHGLAIVIVEGEEAAEVSKFNNNSVCEHLYSSAEFAPRCAEYCGKAFRLAVENGKPTRVKCHADLNFFTVPVNLGETQSVAAIVGRAFLNSEDYRKATERASAGDWRQFPPEKLFSNVLLSGSLADVEKLAKRLEKLDPEERQLLAEFIETRGVKAEKGSENGNAETDAPGAGAGRSSNGLSPSNGNGKSVSAAASEENIREIETVSAWRSLLGNQLGLSYKNTCRAFLDFLAKHYRLSDLAWLDQKRNLLETVSATGNLEKQLLQISVAADAARLLKAAQKESALELRGRTAGELPALWAIRLFPVAVGGEVRGALVVGDEIADDHLKRRLAGFARQIAPQLEILRLREELEKRDLLANASRRFNEGLKNLDGEDFWAMLVQISAELMRAERSSLLVFDCETGEFSVKAAVGNRAEVIKLERTTLGARVAEDVLESSAPLVVRDIESTSLTPAPPEWNYKTKSFISYPIIINGQKIGVFNAADKVGGEAYDDFDLELLQTFVPQLAIALDRMALKKRAGEFEQLSITDTLTGLVNRRYLEERLAEEISRSQRHGYPMSFLMIDVDDFKTYNDEFTHPEGDKALRIVGHCLKATLRGADVAARYGGEEFSILLPQTHPDEARAIAERIRQLVENTEFPNRRVTISIGVATLSSALRTPEALILAADKALYQAKRAGRNKVRDLSEED